MYIIISAFVLIVLVLIAFGYGYKVKKRRLEERSRVLETFE